MLSGPGAFAHRMFTRYGAWASIRGADGVFRPELLARPLPLRRRERLVVARPVRSFELWATVTVWCDDDTQVVSAVRLLTEATSVLEARGHARALLAPYGATLRSWEPDRDAAVASAAARRGAVSATTHPLWESLAQRIAVELAAGEPLAVGEPVAVEASG